MFDSMRIRTKLVVAVVIPLLALVGLALVATSASNDKADEAEAKAAAVEDQVALATSSLGPGGLVIALQNERNGESIEMLGLVELAGGEGPADLRPRTDEAIAGFTARISASSPAVQQAYAEALAAISRIPELRERNDAFEGPRTIAGGGGASDASFGAYSEVISEVFNANSAVATAITEPELRAGATFFDQLARQTEAQSLAIQVVSSQLFAPTEGGMLGDPEAFGRGSRYVAISDALKDEMLRSPAAVYRDLAEEYYSDPGRDAFDGLVATAFSTGEVDASVFLSDELTAAGPIGDSVTARAAGQLTSDAAAITAAAQREAEDASRQAQLVTWVTIAVLLLALLVSLMVSRSITKPLARLVRDADDMANNRLPGTVRNILEAPLGEDVEMPELLDVSAAGGHEIAEVASALNSVQASAAGLAVEQAVLRRNISDSFVNLGRRNQNLLTRQLEHITVMEHEASDPDELKQLFVLDHLATRMRRNAESLLLLAGLEPHRQWSAPVAIIDVLRGALGEVEDYDRVSIKRLDEAVITGSHAADLTHLIAELLENALNFSPPGRPVEMAGWSTPEGYSLAIIDYGVGMDAEALERANLRLSGGESFTVAPSRYLGHYVVGIQARRLGVTVQLQETPAGGITARLDITAVLASDPSSAPADAGVAPTGHITPDRFDQVRAAAPERVPTDAAPTSEPARSAQASLARVSHAVGVAPAGQVADLAPPPAPNALEVETTPSGYTKRVRGANVPRTDVLPARADTDPSPATEAPVSAAESMRSMLSGLQAGADRARDELRTPSNDAQEGSDDRR